MADLSELKAIDEKIDITYTSPERRELFRERSKVAKNIVMDACLIGGQLHKTDANWRRSPVDRLILKNVTFEIRPGGCGPVSGYVTGNEITEAELTEVPLTEVKFKNQAWPIVSAKFAVIEGRKIFVKE